MKALIVLLFLGISRGEGSVLDVYVSDSTELDETDAKSFNVSVERANSLDLNQMYDGPVFIVTPAPGSDPVGINGGLRLTAFYAHTGLKDVVEQPRFAGLHQFLRANKQVSALAYPCGGKNFLDLQRSYIDSVQTGDNFQLIDLIRGTEHGNIHFLYVAPRQVFNYHRFASLKRMARFLVSQYSIDPVWSADPSLPVKKVSEKALADVEETQVLDSVFPVPKFYNSAVLYRAYRQTKN